LPSIPRAFMSMCARGWAYIVKAGTIILLCNTAVQVMQLFNWSFQLVEEGMENTSILATIATPFAYVLIPVIGYHCWQLAAAAVTGFIAKENVVGTLAVCFGISNLINVEELALEAGAEVSQVAMAFGGGAVPMTAVAALAYLMFNLFTPPCFAAIGAMNSEIKDRKWLWGGIGLQLSVGYTVGYLVYQIGTLITTGSFGAGFLPGLIAVAAIVAYIVYLISKADRNLAREYKLKAQA
ncbi:MAG: ferrous iron transporter B, partial [Clostridia bacterium]|nr:ferrous iron transporter B [Clostridia bacterium]